MAKKKVAEIEDHFNPYADIDDALDSIEKDYGLISSGLDKNEKRLSTGLLVLDLIVGKGVAGGGWYSIFGGESCAKSTTATTIMANSVNSEVPIVQLWDYEGSSEPNYLENILQAQGIKVSVSEIFGIRDPETSKYVVKPRVRLYNESIAEKFFDSVAKLQRMLPDKLKFGDDWFYVYEHTKENIALLKGNYDKTFYQKTGKMRIPAENSMPQALLLVDSYPAMLPEGQDVDDPKSAMAMQARMFSEQIKRVKGKMKNKRITVVGMNQLREKPMVMYGSPHYEPGGQALKFYSDCRVQVSARSNIYGKGMLDEEASYDGQGSDKYRYIHAKATKNKLSTPYLEGMMRVWVEDANGKARGFDPVFDTYQYLLTTGQLTGKRNSFKLLIPKMGEHKALKWNDFKTLILGTKQEQIEIFKKIGVEKPFNLRKFCQKQLEDGDGLTRFFDNFKNVKADGQDDSD